MTLGAEIRIILRNMALKSDRGVRDMEKKILAEIFRGPIALCRTLIDITD